MVPVGRDALGHLVSHPHGISFLFPSLIAFGVGARVLTSCLMVDYQVVARWRTARALSAHHRIPLPYGFDPTLPLLRWCCVVSTMIVDHGESPSKDLDNRSRADHQRHDWTKT
eukprot:1452051-Rhodomonas_salina.1